MRKIFMVGASAAASVLLMTGFINCVAVKYCGECGARMKNAGVKPEDLPLPALDER